MEWYCWMDITNIHACRVGVLKSYRANAAVVRQKAVVEYRQMQQFI